MSPRRLQLLEIGASQLTCGVFASKSGRLVLEYWDQKSIDPEWTTNLPQFEKLLPTLAAFATRQPKRAGTLLLPGHLVLTKIVSIAPSATDGGMQLDPAEHIPLALSDVVWAWRELGGDATSRIALIAAARRAQVERMCEVVADAGLEIASVVPASAGMLTALTPDGRDVAIASIDVRSTLLAAVSGSQGFVRTIPIGIPSPAADRLGQEIGRTLTHWTQTFGLPAPEVLQLAGADLAEGLRGGLSPRVEHYNAAAEIELVPGTGPVPGAPRPEMIGAARALLLLRQPLIDLSPDALVRKRASRKRSRLRFAVAALAVLTLLPPLLFYRAAAAETMRRALVVEGELRAVTSLQSANAARLLDIEQLRSRLQALRPAYAARDSWNRFLAELQDCVAGVGEAWLDRLQVVAASGQPAGQDGRRLLVGGRLLASGGTPAAERARQLLGGLARSTFVSALEGERFEAGEDGSLRFAVTLVLKPDSPL